MRADAALTQADAAAKAGADNADVDHLAYVAQQRVVIAQEAATSRAAQAQVDRIAAERDQKRLMLRTQEAETAQRQLAQSPTRQRPAGRRAERGEHADVARSIGAREQGRAGEGAGNPA